MLINSYRHRLFAASLLIALLGSFSTAQAKRASQGSGSATTVVIDAGHGGYDRGGIPAQQVAEQDMTLGLAQRRQRVDAAGGSRGAMARHTDLFGSLRA